MKILHATSRWPSLANCLAIAGTGIMLSGCAVWFDPYIDLPDRKLADYQTDTANFPQLLKAAEETEVLRKQAQDYRGDLVVGRSLLTYGAFGAAAAGGIAALYGAHPDLVLGLGVGAASAYGVGSLFASTDRVDIYSATNRSLNCVVGTADGVLSTGVVLKAQTADGSPYENNYKALKGFLQKPPATWPPESIKAGQEAESLYDAAKTNTAIFMSQDAGFATVVRRTRDTIIASADEKIRASQPGIDAAIKVAQGIGVAGVAYANGVTVTKAPEKAGTSKIAPMSAKDESDLARFTALTKKVKEASEALNKTMTSTTNEMDQIAQTCVLDLPAVSELSVSPTAVTLAKDQTVTLVAQGGKKPLTYTWKGATPPKSDLIEVVVTSGNEIILVGKAGLDSIQADTDFILLVRDSLAAPHEVEVTVSAKGKSSS